MFKYPFDLKECAMKYCPECKQERPENHKFCCVCGKELVNLPVGHYVAAGVRVELPGGDELGPQEEGAATEHKMPPTGL